MSKVTDDCFACGSGLMTAAEALAMLEQRVQPVTEVERVPLGAARGRTLAADLMSPVTIPPSDNSAVDGYAVRFDDLARSGATRLPVSGRAAAGRPLEGAWRPGAAVRIFTGAALPEGCDTVAMQEDVTAGAAPDDDEGGSVTFPPGLRLGLNRRRAGEDLQRGSRIVTAGSRLRAQDIAIAAAAGHAELTVHRRLRVALFSTGDELREPGTPLEAGAIYDSNRYLLAALLAEMAVDVEDLGILPDRPEQVRAALQAAAANHDLLVTSGGVSVGEEDHVRGAVEALGRLHFWRLAVKPGKPLALGQIGRAVFVGLPGNPVAAMVSFLCFGRPILLRRMGARRIAPRRYAVVAAFDYDKPAGRREWLRARLEEGADGLTAHLFPHQGSGVISSLVASEGLVELPEAATRVAAGETVSFLPFQQSAE